MKTLDEIFSETMQIKRETWFDYLDFLKENLSISNFHSMENYMKFIKYTSATICPALNF